MGIQILYTASLAVLVLAFNLIITNDNTNAPLFWVAVGLFLVACLGWYKAIELARRKDDKRDKQDDKRDIQMKALIRELKGLREDLRKRE